MKVTQIYFAMVVVLSSQGCGGNEPVSILGDPSVIVPNNKSGLILPLGSGTSLAASGSVPQIKIESGFSSTASGSGDGIGLTTQASTPTNIIAPGAGVIVGINMSPNTGYVIIWHNAHVSSRVSNFSPGVQIGSYVNQGTVIGTSGASGTLNTVYLSVYLDGVLTCPLSFINATARTALAQPTNWTVSTLQLCSD